MSLEHAFDLWDWPTVIGLAIVGVIFGFLLLPYAWPDRQTEGRAYPALMTALLVAFAFATCFVFLIAGRYLKGFDPTVTARTIGTAIETIVFALALGVGLQLRAPDTRKPPGVTLDDLAAQLVDIRRLTSAASDSAELAHTAASAADDRVISQAERSMDDRARSLRIEDVSTDTNHRAMDIQDRIKP